MAKETKGASEETNQELSLSAALLAPLNSIFEAQIHAARAFLNFILQMGFRHKYSDEEKNQLRNLEKTLPKDSTEYREVKQALDQVANEEKRKAELSTLLDKAKKGEKLSEAESWQVQDYAKEYGDLYQQCVQYIDNTGIQRKIYIPNLALLPIQPLSIESAKFNYEMYVSDTSKQYDQMGTIPGLRQADRPWFLIKPKSVRGQITSSEISQNTKTIKIEMNIKSGDMPYGLHKLLTTMTNIAGDTEQKPLPPQEKKP
jgi:hypothetical protein